MRLRLPLLLLLAACIGLGACKGAERPIARLVESEGQVERSAAAAPEAWAAAAKGDAFGRGSGVRTGAAASARLELADGGVLRMGPASLVRFGAGAAGDANGAGVSLEAGEAEIETGGAEFVVGTRGGRRARLAPGSRARLTQSDGSVHLVVEVGAALIEEDGQKSVGAPNGQPVDLGALAPAGPVGVPTPPGSARDAGVAAAPNGDAGAGPVVDLPGGSIEFEKQLAAADFALPADEEATVHDPAPPSAVRLSFTHLCEGVAQVEVRHGRSRTRVQGDGSVVVALTAGVHDVQVRCVGAKGPDSKPRAHGTVRVVRDEGRRQVRTSAPRNTVEADGRSYRLLYQNRKPTIAFTWPQAPEATGYSLALEDGEGHTRRIHASGAKPLVTLGSGQIAEGHYRFWFAADGLPEASARSPQTRLELDFDNAAPVAGLDEPASPAAWRGADVLVAGSATEGASVSIGGVPLPVDGDFRFSGRVAVPAGGRAVAVRIAQRDRGIHYFLRRRP
jgi:hypothetical protein